MLQKKIKQFSIRGMELLLRIFTAASPIIAVLAVVGAVLIYGMYQTMKVNIDELKSYNETLAARNATLTTDNAKLATENAGYARQFAVVHKRIDDQIASKHNLNQQQLQQIIDLLEKTP